VLMFAGLFFLLRQFIAVLPEINQPAHEPELWRRPKR
jgi:hypothetical protein